MQKNTPILDLVQQLGASIAGNLGVKAFIELELAFVTALLPRFIDNPLIRVLQHILLYARAYVDSESYVDFMILGTFFEGLGVLVKKGLIDVALVQDLV